MTTAHIPTLSSIVDSLTARLESIEQDGDPAEIRVLQEARRGLVDYALGEDVRAHRHMGLIDLILERVRKTPA
ncbi:MAG TPA: hypothetical protein VM450_17700 [Thermomicrobiales bacterium]|nr:hypothetical protein [Thermomicrobiales bacterium]